MGLSVWITYLIATIILSVSPGPGVFSSISSGLHHGFRAGMQWPQYAILAATTFVIDVIVMLGYTALAAKALRVTRDPSRLRWVNRGLGGAFVAAGVALASFRRAGTSAAAL